MRAVRLLALTIWAACFVALGIVAEATVSPLRAETEVDLQLVLAVDASGSVSETRFELQKQGYVAAFRNPELLRAVQSGRGIAVTMMQWTGPPLQIQTVPWTLVTDEASMRAFANAVEAAPRRLFGGGTSISGAIDHSMALFDRSPFTAGRKVIDISGDGRNNRGRPATDARDEAVRDGISINGLPILALEPDLEQYYRNNVIGGPGAFVVVAETFETFGDAILKKLIIEISGAQAPRPEFAARSSPGNTSLD